MVGPGRTVMRHTLPPLTPGTVSLCRMRIVPGPAVILVALLSILLLATSCTSEEKPSAAPTAQPTPLSAFDATAVTIARTDFCDRIPETAVEDAVGEVEGTDHYGNGEPATIVPGVKDVSHEFNCTFNGTSGATARVWVFVPQVTRARARKLVSAAGEPRGCRLVEGDFGEPSTGVLCRSDSGTDASYRGLFGDSWLSCSVSDPDRRAQAAPLLERAGDWCVQSTTAAATASE